MMTLLAQTAQGTSPTDGSENQKSWVDSKKDQ